MVKEGLALLGKIERSFRLPMCETTEANLDELKRVMMGVGLPIKA
jgi:hypothetical protein